jgi:hypothetical protein
MNTIARLIDEHAKLERDHQSMVAALQKLCSDCQGTDTECKGCSMAQWSKRANKSEATTAATVIASGKRRP